jgi:beta-mannosidase
MTAGSELSADPSAAGGKIPNPDHRHWEGRRWLRKPAFEYGWDWVDALPNISIWRGVRLEGRRHAVIDDLRLDTVLRDGRVFVELEAMLENLHWRSGRACVFDLAIHPPDGGAPITRHYAIDLPPGRAPVRDLIEIPNAKLWWPNGMGDQPMYRVVANVGNAAGESRDRREFSIGLRTIELDRSRAANGARFCFRVNGQEVFCRGGNLGPLDPILARVTDEKYRQLVADARDAHFNMLRINGCSSYEGPAFYDACDRAGILIYQDFMFTDLTYPQEDAEFVAAARDETEAAVRMLRHHPCIALWAGNNENTMLFSGSPGYGEKLYGQIFPELCSRIDPRRPYWPGSPAGGKDPNSQMIGDCHWWDDGWMNSNLKQRISPAVYDNCRARFLSEYGVIGPCHIDSIREYLAAVDTQRKSPAWKMHTNDYEEGTLPAAIRTHYADPTNLSLEEYSLYGQLFQATMHESAIEAMRFRKHDPADDCAGILMWSYSDCWGETGWSLLDYYLRRKASYYAARRASAPVKVIVRKRDDHYVTRAVNDTLDTFGGTVDVGWWRLDGTARNVDSRHISLEPNSMLEVANAPAPPADERDPRVWVYAAVLRDSQETAFDQSLCFQEPCRRRELPKPKIAVKAVGDDLIEVSSPVYAHAVHVEDHGREVISNNWFDLLPGVPVRVRLATGIQPSSLQFQSVLPK